MAIRVLGPLETGTERALSPRERMVLAALIVRAGRPVSPGELAEACWGENPPRTWQQQVKTSVARIRAGMGSAAVLTRGSAYTLGVDPATIDAFEFERLVSTARQHGLHEEYDRAAEIYRRALALWRGAAFAELSDWTPATVEAQRLAEICESAREELLESRLAEGEHRAVIAEAERLVRAAPLREERWAILALANYRAGRQAEALATVRAARLQLADELGIDIGERLKALEASMLRQDPALTLVRTLHKVSDACPYRGLAAYSAADSEDFFGREADVAALQDRVQPGALTLVVGASGSGKSSLVLAGVVPRLAPDRDISTIAAGRDAAAALRSRITDGEKPDLVVIDQAEALFQCPERERDDVCALVDDLLLAGAAVLMTLRSDFLDRAVGMPHIGHLIGRGMFAIGPLSADGLRDAIERPAVRAGLRLEHGLVEVIVRDAGDRRSTLPHVSHALVETWIRREGSTMTVGGYEASGGIAGAIAQSAETLYRSFDADEAAACRALMLRLVQRSPDGASVRRVAQLGPLMADAVRRRVLDRFVAARLLTIDGETLVVAHEAVADAWPRLDGWLEEDAEGTRVMAAVATAAELWEADGRQDADLLRGARLQAALEWEAASHPDLTASEHALLDASAAREQDEMRTLADHAAREARSNRRLRWALSGAAVLLVAALVSGGIAVVRGQDAAAAARNQLIEAVTANSMALRATNRDIAALLAVESHRRWPEDARTRAALMGTLTAADSVVGVTYLDDIDWRAGMAPIPGTNELAVARGTHLRIYDARTGTVLRELTDDLIPSDVVIRPWVRVSADGTTIAVLQHSWKDQSTYSDDEEIVYFFDIASGARRGDPIRVPTSAETFTLSDDGRYATWATLGVLAVVDSVAGTAATNAAFVPEGGVSEVVAASAFTPDGRIVVGTVDGRFSLVDPVGLTVEETRPARPGFVESSIVSTGSGLTATLGRDGVAVWDADGTELWHRANESPDECSRMTASAVGDVLACGDELGTVQAWRLTTGERIVAPTSYQLGGSGDLALVDGGRELLLLSALAPAVGRLRVDGAGPSSRMIAEGYVPDGGLNDDASLILVEALTNWTAQTEVPRFAVWDVASDTPVFRVPEDVKDSYDGVLGGLRWLGDSHVATWESVESEGEESFDHLRVVDTATGRFVTTDLPADVWEVYPSAREERVFVTTQPGNEVLTIDSKSLEEIAPRLDVPAPILTVSDDAEGGSVVVTYVSDVESQAQTTVYDAATGDATATGLSTYVETQALADGQMIASNGTHIGRFAQGDLTRLGTVPISLGFVSETYVSADGNEMLLKGAGARAIALYDPDSDRPLGDAMEQRGVGRASLARDGTAFAVSGREGVILWTLDEDQQRAAACRIAGRELTPQEWATYLGDTGPQHPICADVLGG